MATIDLGKIKLVWRGTYSGGTAYTVDDVVQHTDSGLTSSFICTTASTGNAPSTGGTVHGSWAYLAKGGVAGTDVGTTITTQGDILYRDGSGLQRLAKPASNKMLQNTSGGVLSWESVSSDVVRLATDSFSSDVSSVTVDNVFSDTYHWYRIVFYIMSTAALQPQLYFLDTSGSVQGSDYSYSGWQAAQSSGSSSSGNAGHWSRNYSIPQENYDSSTSKGGSIIYDIVQPYSSSICTSWYTKFQTYDGTNMRSGFQSGIHYPGAAAASRGFKIDASTGNFRDSSEISVYGFKHS